MDSCGGLEPASIATIHCPASLAPMQCSVPADAARPLAVLDTVPATYIERSPGGHGLHLFGFGRLPAGRVVSVDGGKVELYGRGRYLRMTGQAFGACPSALADLESFIAALTA